MKCVRYPCFVILYSWLKMDTVCIIPSGTSHRKWEIWLVGISLIYLKNALIFVKSAPSKYAGFGIIISEGMCMTVQSTDIFLLVQLKFRTPLFFD